MDKLLLQLIKEINMMLSDAQQLKKLLLAGFKVNYTVVKRRSEDIASFIPKRSIYVDLYPDTSNIPSVRPELDPIRFYDSNGDFYYYTDILPQHILVYPPEASVKNWQTINFKED